MNHTDWKLKERNLERAVRAAAKTIGLSRGSLTEKLELVKARDAARENLRQHRLTPWDGLKP